MEGARYCQQGYTKGRGRVESTAQEKPATGARATARQCLPTGEGERPAAATGFGEPGRLWENARAWEPGA